MIELAEKAIARGEFPHKDIAEILNLPLELVEELASSRAGKSEADESEADKQEVDESEADASEPGDSNPDTFYAESNIRYLEGIVQDIKDGKAHFAEHELME